MEFNGEHLLPGRLGHFFLILSLVSSLGATISYFLSVQKGRKLGNEVMGNGVLGSMVASVSAAEQWKRLARIFFITQVLSVFAVFATLFYIISHHYFEYKYAWQHSSLDLEPKYLLACFWEGQEGSFLLWSLWHSILGIIFIWRQKDWESPVMTIISFAQVLLATMIIGFDVFGMKIGSNPFVLMRNVFDLKTQIPQLNLGDNYKNYLTFLADGNGLNILLRNYWMVIHPPILFLGFASTIIPFAFVMAGLWTKRFTEWTKPALPWALFSAGVLGLGIMMGAKWAYESLNFGGYWAWDPVENASLVPWLLLLAGIHTLVIFRHTGNALRTTCLFLILSFVLVLYSTYLTRSGDLQDTSVHAFTGDGITVWHLRILLFVFALPAFGLLIKRYKQIPYIAKEEETSSREFWMFVGSLVIFLSALVIIGMTSIPVINKLVALFSGNNNVIKPLRMQEDSAHAYNQVQVFVAIILGTFTGFGMYLKYKSTGKAFLKKLLWPSVAGLLIAALILSFGDINYNEKGMGYMIAVWIAVVAATYSVIANGAYIFSGAKSSLKKAGGAIAHFGFALMLLGILISSSKKEVLSYNTSGISVFLGNDGKEKPGENLTLVKGVRTDMGKFWVTYASDSVHPMEKNKWFYRLKFEAKDNSDEFSLYPNAYINPKGEQGLSANPDAKHYATYDIFTYITSLPDPNKNKDTSQFRPNTLSIGDTAFYSNGFMVVDAVTSNPSNGKYHFTSKDTALMAEVSVHSKDGPTYQARPVFYLRDNRPQFIADTVYSQNLALAFTGIADQKKIELQVKESNTLMEYITLKAYKFPFINLLWGGTVIMVFGFFVSAWNRKERKREKMLQAAHKEQAARHTLHTAPKIP
ncbi:MAG: cytochrome c biogenesis protein CcsA [Flavisolibacter sp.]